MNILFSSTIEPAQRWLPLLQAVLPEDRFYTEADDKADIALVDPEKPWIVDSRKMAASAGNTPFDGQPVQGRVVGLWKGGVQVG